MDGADSTITIGTRYASNPKGSEYVSKKSHSLFRMTLVMLLRLSFVTPDVKYSVSRLTHCLTERITHLGLPRGELFQTLVLQCEAEVPTDFVETQVDAASAGSVKGRRSAPGGGV